MPSNKLRNPKKRSLETAGYKKRTKAMRLLQHFQEDTSKCHQLTGEPIDFTPHIWYYFFRYNNTSKFIQGNFKLHQFLEHNRSFVFYFRS